MNPMRIDAARLVVSGRLTIEASTIAAGMACAAVFAGSLRARGWNVDAVVVDVVTDRQESETL